MTTTGNDSDSTRRLKSDYCNAAQNFALPGGIETQSKHPAIGISLYLSNGNTEELVRIFDFIHEQNLFIIQAQSRRLYQVSPSRLFPALVKVLLQDNSRFKVWLRSKGRPGVQVGRGGSPTIDPLCWFLQAYGIDDIWLDDQGFYLFHRTHKDRVVKDALCLPTREFPRWLHKYIIEADKYHGKTMTAGQCFQILKKTSD